MTTKKYILLYSAFVLIKALTGYLEWGTLALRHSALFYYPFFALITYTFYNRRFVNFVVFPAILIGFTTVFFGTTTRTMIISNFITMVFLIVSLGKIAKTKRVVVVGILLLSSFLYYQGVNKDALNTIVNLKKTTIAFKVYGQKVKNMPTPELPTKRTKLYNPEVRGNPSGIPHAKWRVNENHIFRMLIWQDMIRELTIHKPLFGFPYGKPFNSRNLVALGWGETAWRHDGWIAAHNSYLELIYRGGVVGVVFIIFIVVLLYIAVCRNISNKSIIGIVLCAAVLNYFIQANFLLTFELPYTAIPLWCLFGLTLARKNEHIF